MQSQMQCFLYHVLDRFVNISRSNTNPSRPLEVKTPASMHEHRIFHSPNAHQQKTYTMHIFPNISFFHNYLHLQQLQMKHKQQPQWPSFINKLKWTKHISCAASQTLIKQAHCQTQASILHIYICTYKTEYNLAHIISKCHSSEVSW